MQSAANLQKEENVLVPADELRRLTISKEEILKRQKASVLDSLMSSMVRIATEQGRNSYTANVEPKFDPTLLGDITKELTDIGYTVTAETKTNTNNGQSVSFIALNISW